MWKRLIKPATRYPWLARASYNLLGANVTDKLLERTVYPIYCGSNDPDILGKQIERLSDSGVKTILHLALEDHRLYSPEKYSETLFRVMPSLQREDVVAIKLTGLVDRQLLIDNCSDLSRTVIPLIQPIIENCVQKGLLLTIDAEESLLEEGIRRVTLDLMRMYNRGRVVVYQTYQCYLKTTLEKILDDLELSKREDFLLGAKLVRGAYMEWELRQPDPKVWLYINSTAQCYNSAAELLMESRCSLILATHNNEAVRHLSAKADEMEVKPKFAQLLGLNDRLTGQLVTSGQSVYKFVPFGPTRVVIPYLLRRLEENSELVKHTFY